MVTPVERTRPLDYAHIVRILNHAKDLGCNFVRLSHYPHSQHMARAADELGLLVWEEIPVYWAVDFESETTLATAKSQMREMIERDRNRASVVLWSIANETPEGEARNRFLASLAEHVRSLDDSRLVTAALVTDPRELAEFFIGYYLPALLGIERDEWVYRVHDPLFETVDVPALNEYFGWYYAPGFAQALGLPLGYVRDQILEILPEIRIRNQFGKPIIISEFGAGAKRGLKSSKATIWSEDYQALVYAAQLKMISSNEMIKGLAPWILKDFRSHYRTSPGIQDFYNRKGIIDEKGRPKAAFSVLQEFYRATQ